MVRRSCRKGLTKFLTAGEFLDLARFITELGRPGPYAIRTTPTLQRWRLLKSPAPEISGEVPNVEHFRQHVLELPADAWLPLYGTAQGPLPLADVVAALKSASSEKNSGRQDRCHPPRRDRSQPGRRPAN